MSLHYNTISQHYNTMSQHSNDTCQHWDAPWGIVGEDGHNIGVPEKDSVL